MVVQTLIKTFIDTSAVSNTRLEDLWLLESAIFPSSFHASFAVVFASAAPEPHRMDANVLRDRIKATLEPDANVRRQAELDLKYVWAVSPHNVAQIRFVELLN